MKNFIVVICLAILVYGCGKDQAPTSRYGIFVYPDLVSSSNAPVHIKYRISGPDIKTIDNQGPKATVNFFDLKQGTTTSITTSIYEGPDRGLYVTIYKLLPDSTTKIVFEKISSVGTVTGTFKVE